MTSGLAQSVLTRLVRHAQSLGVDPNLVLARYATERLLYRLSRSAYADHFVLKGALLLTVWLGETTRPTRDADLLGFGTLTADELATIIADLCAISVQPDGMLFEATSIRVNAIRPEDAYGGQRITLDAHLGTARLRVQVDVGIGDSVTPDPVWIDYPSLLDLPRPRLRAYRPETAIAEKVHAMVVLGTTNSRMKDFFDVYALAMRRSFDGAALRDAVCGTFHRRHTTIPKHPPIAFTPAFAKVDGKGAQWVGFVRRSGLVATAPDLGDVIELLRTFAMPILSAATTESPYTQQWRPGGPWEMGS